MESPARWHQLPRPSPADFAQAMLEILRMPAGQIMMNGLIHAYLLEPVSDENLARSVGRQDVVKHMMEMAGLGIYQHQQMQEVRPNGGSDWFPRLDRDGGR